MSAVEKLPKWAQEHIRKLEMQREAAIRTLNDFTANQKPSNIWFEDYTCTGEQQGPAAKRCYVHSHSVTFALGKEEITVGFSFQEPTLRISTGMNQLQLRPSASNVIEILEVKR